MRNSLKAATFVAAGAGLGIIASSIGHVVTAPEPTPAPTVTATQTVTSTVTATPAPAPTVTKTITVETKAGAPAQTQRPVQPVNPWAGLPSEAIRVCQQKGVSPDYCRGVWEKSVEEASQANKQSGMKVCGPGISVPWTAPCPSEEDQERLRRGY